MATRGRCLGNEARPFFCALSRIDDKGKRDRAKELCAWLR